MKKKYNAVIIGCGRIGSTFSKLKQHKKIFGISSHAEMYKSSKEISLISAADTNKKKLKDFKSTWNITNLHQKPNKVFHKKVDVISICTHLDSHYNLINLAIENNTKVIFCEKPFVNNLIKAKKILNKVKKKKISLFINFWRRWNSTYINLKRSITKNELGKIHHVSCYYSGGLNNTGSHLVDVLNYLFGKVSYVYSKKINNYLDPDVIVQLGFKNGFNAILNPIPKKSYYMFEIDIYGSKGRIRLENNGLNIKYWKFNNSKKGLTLYKNRKIKVPLNQFQGQLKSIIKFLKKGIIENTFEDTYSSLEILIAANISMKKNKIVKLPVKDLNFSIKSK